MTLWTLLQAALMLTNGLAILNNDRFLEKYGFGFSQMSHRGPGEAGPGALKQQAIGLLHAVAYLRVPLIAINALVICVKLIFG